MNELLANLNVRPNDVAIRYALADYIRDQGNDEEADMWLNNEILPYTPCGKCRIYNGTYNDALALTKVDKNGR